MEDNINEEEKEEGIGVAWVATESDVTPTKWLTLDGIAKASVSYGDYKGPSEWINASNTYYTKNHPLANYIAYPTKEEEVMAENDAIKNFQILKEKLDNGFKGPILNSPPRSHRTLIVVHADQSSSPDYRERAARFVTSLNLSSTIKADVITVADGTIIQGLCFTGKKAGGVDVPSDGYSQVCVLKSAHS